MGADHTAEDLRGDADDGADHNEEKNGEIVLEVHDEALVERSVEKTLHGLQYRIAQSWLFAYTRIVRLETLNHLFRVADPDLRGSPHVRTTGLLGPEAPPLGRFFKASDRSS
jgi:hypothetical protein